MANTYVNLNTPYDAQLESIKRQQKYAELLAQQGAGEIDAGSVGGVPTPISPFQGLAKVFQQGMGGYLAGQATKDQAALDTAQSQKYADALSQMYDPRVDMSNKNDFAITGKFDPATGKPGANVGMVDTSGIYNRDPTSAEQSQAARGLIGTKYADLVPGMLSEVQKTAAAERERQRTLDQEKSLTKPANVSDAAWNSAANVPGMRTDLFSKNSVTKYGDFAQELINSGIAPGTDAFNRAMADKRRKETYIAPVAAPAPGAPQSYVINGKQVFTTPQDALAQAKGGAVVTTAAEAKPKTPAAQTVDQLKNRQLFTVVTPELKTLTKNWDELGKKQNQVFAAIGDAKIPWTNIGVPKGSVTGTEYQQAESSLSVIAASYIYSVSGATASPEEVKKTVAALMPAFGEGEEQKKSKLARINTMVEAIGERAKGGFNAAPSSNGDSPPASTLQELQEGENTTFENGQVWTLQNNVPVRVQ